MQTGAFEASLTELLGLSSTHRVALMCAESVPWRCHRSLIRMRWWRGEYRCIILPGRPEPTPTV